ncbi:ABC transporter permease [Nocardioides sp. R-C-SC26]|uniref:branched-chain amino acid ABC transporter permease n=1 Tax=Nocardioides sp. R-C-SC26 TaxID=2870414 RepID=UPI001E2FF569|nr:ABC transporter permease [Nocardioides sp. R-C-SC26]
MDKFIAYALPGLFTGAAYAIAASGLVLTYTTTRVFNIAHGAFGMVMSFIFWDFSQRQGIPVWLSLILVLLVVAPLTGFVVQRFIARGLGDAPVSVSLVVTVGLFVGLIGLAQQVWEPEPRFVPPFWQDKSFEIGDSIITGHQVITILASIAVAVGLYFLLNRTRIGTAMRASVDNPELLRLFGGKPDTVAALSWAIGMSLSALAGILLVSVVGLDYFQLTLLVINAYAAAMVGRLKSLPLTFIGAMALGLLDSFALGYIDPESWLADFRPVIPPLFLFAVIVLMPTAQLRIGQVKGIVSAPVPSLTRMAVSGAAFMAFVFVATAGMSEANLLRVGAAATYAIVMLSLVLLTGYGGYVSLSQLTFAGVGALAYAKLDEPNLYGLIVSTLIAGAVGALVALPTLRLTGLYLALSTLAFGVLMDKVVFQDEKAFGFGGALSADRMSVFGTTIGSTGNYVLLMAFFFVLCGIGVLILRRGVLGRMLVALRDSPAACGTLGLDARWFRVGLFGISAAVAGLAGALFAGLRGTIGAADFQYFNSLPLLLLAVVFGVTSVTGAALGGIGLMLLPVLQAEEVAGVSLGGLMFVIIGFGAVFAGRDPNGLANLLFKIGRWGQRRIVARVDEATGGSGWSPIGPRTGQHRAAGDDQDGYDDGYDDAYDDGTAAGATSHEPEEAGSVATRG